MDQAELILTDNLREYLELAEEAYIKEKYNSSATLFFKALCAGIDLYVYQKRGFVPSSHTHRFRVLEEHYPELYRLIDKDFSFYQDSYTTKLSKEACEVLADDARYIAKEVLKE